MHLMKTHFKTSKVVKIYIKDLNSVIIIPSEHFFVLLFCSYKYS